jgi:Di-haem oxidoreductase, putative peroxidase
MPRRGRGVPNGASLDNPPSARAGGVFAGDTTARRSVPKAERNGLWAMWFNHRPSAQLTPGALQAGVLGTAFLGPSPDGSGLAVFAVATADGALAQVHVQDGVDGLAPAGTLSAGAADPGVIGMAFKWIPSRAIFLTDVARNRLQVLHLGDDTRHFTVARREFIEAPQFKQPVDLVAAIPEVANPRFASHTTLAGGSDLYVANRGDGSVLRIDERGHVLARASIELPDGSSMGAGRLRAIAVSADAQRLWLTLEGEVPGFAGHEGSLIEIAAFDDVGPFEARSVVDRTSAVQATQANPGEQLFGKTFTPAEGLGPLFNANSCATCHFAPTLGGMSSTEAHFVRRVARMDAVSGRVQPLVHPNSPVARRHSTLELGAAGAPAAALPRQANVTSLRMPPALYPVARLDEIPDAVIEAQAVAKGDGIKGRVNHVVGADGEPRVGRYGWKADAATLELMVADAFGNELGVTSALARPVPPSAEDDGRMVRAVAEFLRALQVPPKGAR